MPLAQPMEGGHGEREPRLTIRPPAVHNFLAVAHNGQHRAHGRHEPTVLPRTAGPPCAGGRIPRRGLAGGIAPDAQAAVDVAHAPRKGGGGAMGRGTIPPHHQALRMQEQTACAPDHPALVGQALPTDLLGPAACAPRVDPLDPRGVKDAEHGRSRQEGPRPVLMRLEETKEPRPLGQAGEQRAVVARQPAIKRPIPPTFEGRQPPQGAPRTGPAGRLGGGGDGVQRLIDVGEQSDDHIPWRHAALLSGEGGHADEHGRGVCRQPAHTCALRVWKVLCYL